VGGHEFLWLPSLSEGCNPSPRSVTESSLGDGKFFFSDGYRHAFSEKPVADASAPCKHTMSDGSADGST